MSAVPEVTCVGEALIDFLSTSAAAGLEHAAGFLKAAGGAPANVAVGLARLGTRSAFVGKVGDDPFGHFIAAELRRLGVDINGLRFDRARRTRLAFVSFTADGERDFAFWENHPADLELRFRDIDLPHVLRSRIVHISSFMLISGSTRKALLKLARAAGSHGCLVSFDPNLRLSLWPSKQRARETLLEMTRRSSILRLNGEEARFLTGINNSMRAAERLRAAGPDLVVITEGGKGCYFQTALHDGDVPGFRVPAKDTTGCGDAFLAGLLHGIVARGAAPGDLGSDDLREICRFGNAVGALVATESGAMAAMPALSAVKHFLKMRDRGKTR